MFRFVTAVLCGLVCLYVMPGCGDRDLYSIPIEVIGPAQYASGAQVCVIYDSDDACGPPDRGFLLGETGFISVPANAGTSYIVYVPSNQPPAEYCSVVSGAYGVFGFIMETAVVQCR